MKVCPKYRIPQNLDADFTEAAPGEFRVFIESNLREAVPMWTLWKNRELHRHPDGSNTQLAISLALQAKAIAAERNISEAN